jgi:hypothetical protein
LVTIRPRFSSKYVRTFATKTTTSEPQSYGPDVV